MSEWIEAREVCRLLGVKPQTLYAYVSRGRIRSAPDARDPRRALYAAADAALLAHKRARGRKAADVAAGAIAWGEPVLVSSITTVAFGRLYYRGLDAVDLAETETFEGVARLLRGDQASGAPRRLRSPPPSGSNMRARLFAVLADRACVDPPLARSAEADWGGMAATLLDVVTDAVCGVVESGAIHERLARAWGLGSQGQDLVRRALVLLADHELNASTFAARVAASTGASLSAAVLAGLAVLTGPHHGGAHQAVTDLAVEARRLGPGETVTARLAFWRPAPGFGHPLYPDGDPRARAVLGAFSPPQAHRDLNAAMTAAHGGSDSANVDFALSALAGALDLPPDAPFILFAVARTAGWIAHAIEQARTGALIRPRARYEGISPREV